MSDELEKSRFMDYVEDCIKNIERRGDELINNTMAVQSELISLVKERHNRDRTVIEDRFRSGIQSRGYTTPAIFQPGKSDLGNIKEIFGNILLTYENAHVSLSTSNCKSFQCNEISNMGFIIPTKDCGAWILADLNCLIKLNTRGFIEQTTQFDFGVEHAAIQGSDFMMTSSELLSVKRVSENGFIRTEMSTSPYFPLGIHVTDDGDILVCLVDRYDFSLTTKSRRLVMIYHPIGLIPTVLEYERGNRLFTIPSRVTSRDKDIIVIDVQSRTRNRILGVSKDSKIVFEFSRQGLFIPCDVCSTSKEEIFVLDEASQSIFVLDRLGKLTANVRLSDFCITQPAAMAFNSSDNKLWIGHSFNKVSVFSVGGNDEVKSATKNENTKHVVNQKTEQTAF